MPLGVQTRLIVPWAVNAIPVRVFQGEWATAIVSNVGNASAWFGEGTATIGSGTQLRPNKWMTVPAHGDPAGIFVVASPGGAVLEFLVFA